MLDARSMVPPGDCGSNITCTQTHNPTHHITHTDSDSSSGRLWVKYHLHTDTQPHTSHHPHRQRQFLRETVGQISLTHRHTTPHITSPTQTATVPLRDCESNITYTQTHNPTHRITHTDSDSSTGRLRVKYHLHTDTQPHTSHHSHRQRQFHWETAGQISPIHRHTTPHITSPTQTATVPPGDCG